MTTSTISAPIKSVKSRLKAKDPKSAEPSKPKILIFGKPGVGKTWTSLDFPNVYYIDTEGGADLKHYTDKLKASGGVYMGIKDGTLDLDVLIDQTQALATEKHNYKTLVFDSITKPYIMAITAEAERLGDKDAFGASKKPAIAKIRQLINWIARIDMNVIFIAHEKALWANGEQTGWTFDCYEKLEYELHLCLQIQKRGESRVALVKKSRLLGFPDASNFPWNYAEFAERYGKDVIEASVKQIVLASETQVAEIKKLIDTVRVDAADIDKWMSKAGVTQFEEMDVETIEKCINHLKGKLK
jgi:hypothetical protein